MVEIIRHDNYNVSIIPDCYSLRCGMNHFKGVLKSYFKHYFYLVIVLFKTALCRSSFSAVSFGKLVFRLSVVSLNQDIKICFIMLCNFGMQFCSHLI